MSKGRCRTNRVAPIEWTGSRLRLLDQTRLPHEEVWLELDSPEQVGEAIRALRVRGAPAIGIAAAYGLALVRSADDLRAAADLLAATRPTAVNLSWALTRCLSAAEHASELSRAIDAVLAEAQAIQREALSAEQRIGRNGAEFVADGATVLTHCNTGSLATAGYGTALGVVYAAVEAGKRVRVIATETRPLLQGARLTAWELGRAGIECRLIVDSAAGAVMGRGEIDAVIVGADRIAANGDTANKIGTYSLAVLARAHDVPFYVAAPLSTFDLSIARGDDIVIEQRAADEVTHIAGVRTAAAGVDVFNPAFDVTPNELIAGIITERGIARPPHIDALAAQFTRAEARV